MEETTQLAEASVQDVSVLKEEGYNTLLGLLDSGDTENHVVAQALLTKLNIEKSIFYIWKLASRTRRRDRMINLRTKAGRKFRDDTDLFNLAHKSAYAFAEWAHGKGWLTKEIYELVKDDIISEFTSKSANIFFDMHFVIKDEFKHLDSQDHYYEC